MASDGLVDNVQDVGFLDISWPPDPGRVYIYCWPLRERRRKKKILAVFPPFGGNELHVHMPTVYHFNVLSYKILRFLLHFFPFKEPAEKSEVISSPGSPEVIPVPYLRSLHPRIPSPWADRVATEVTVESLFLDKSHLVLMRTLFHGWKAAASKVQPRSTYHRLIVCTHHVQQTQSLSLSKYSLSLLPSGLVWCWNWASVFPTGCEVRMQEHSGS